MLNFAYTIVYVDNVDETLSFYENAFGFKRKFLHESGDYGELDSGATTLAFAQRTMIADEGLIAHDAKTSKSSFELDFTTDDVAAAVEHAIKAGAKLVKEIEVKPWGQTVAYVSDNSGFLIEICTPVTT